MDILKRLLEWVWVLFDDEGDNPVKHRRCIEKHTQHFRCPCCREDIAVFVDIDYHAYPLVTTSFTEPGKLRGGKGPSRGIFNRRYKTGADILRDPEENWIPRRPKR